MVIKNCLQNAYNSVPFIHFTCLIFCSFSSPHGAFFTPPRSFILICICVCVFLCVCEMTIRIYFRFLMLTRVASDFFWSLNDQADVSVGSTQHSLSSSLSESSDSDNSIATRRANIDATSWNVLERSFSFCSLFSTFRNVMPVKWTKTNYVKFWNLAQHFI